MLAKCRGARKTLILQHIPEIRKKSPENRKNHEKSTENRKNKTSMAGHQTERSINLAVQEKQCVTISKLSHSMSLTSDFLIRPGNFVQNKNGEWHVFLLAG
jgi:hypothetical protein